MQSWPVQIFSECTTLSDLLAVFQNASDDGTDKHDRHNSTSWKPLFRVLKCVSILPNTEASVSVMTSRDGPLYIAPHPNSMRDEMVLQAPGVVNAVLHIPTKMCMVISSKIPTTRLKRILAGVMPNLPKEIVHSAQTATISSKERKEEDTSVAYTVVALHHKGKESREDPMARHKKSRRSMIMSCIQIGDTTSILVHSTPKIVRTF